MKIGTGQRVFIIDDEPLIASTLGTIFERGGFASAVYDDPLELLEACEKHTPDAVISDVMMPQMSGIELASRLQERHPAYQECQRLSVSNDFAAAVMHEINNPLEAITNLVQDEATSSDERSRYLDQVQEQLVLLTSVARSSLAFYKGQDESRDIDLMEVAESALKLHFRRLHLGHVRVSTEYCENASCRGIGSEILQVVSNLILNAMDALADTPEAAIKVTVRRRKSSLHLSIHDNGPGVPQHLEATLFEAHATSKKTGTGMGLWLSRRIVTKHGGTLGFRTSRTSGRSGTLFRMALPIQHIGIW